MPVVLQIAPPPVPDWVQLFSQGMNVLAAFVGLLIAYQAYRGYRRNHSRPMLFIALGFALTVGLPFVMAVPTLLANSPGAAAALIVLADVSTLVGLGCILYGLRMPT